jgi:phosphoribosylcarboxyaminoimidazole (NCAIR) mutase
MEKTEEKKRTLAETIIESSKPITDKMMELYESLPQTEVDKKIGVLSAIQRVTRDAYAVEAQAKAAIAGPGANALAGMLQGMTGAGINQPGKPGGALKSAAKKLGVVDKE